MNLIRTHIVMIHGAGTAAVGMQHSAAVLVLPVLIWLLSTLFGAMFVSHQGGWPAASGMASPLLSDVPVSRPGRCRLPE